MIKTLAAVIDEFIKAEAEKYEAFGYKHAPTLGDLFEGLTGEVVDKAIPKNLDLHVVSGFVYDDHGFKSGQIDKMLVHGPGRPIGFTGKYECHLENVLVIFEVKKTLGKADLIDAYGHLLGVSQAYSENFERKLQEGWRPGISKAAKAFAQITGKPEPEEYADLHGMETADSLLFYSLVQDVYAPVRIIHGYGGYRTEQGLRTAFLDFLEERSNTPGFGVPALPSLITSERFSLVKTVGNPYAAAMREDGYWPVLCSSRDNTPLLLLEMIWTKIANFADVRMPWGDDLEGELLIRLLDAKYTECHTTGRKGWLYRSVELPEKELQTGERVQPWKPEILSGKLSDLVQVIGMRGGQLDGKSRDFIEFCGGKDAARELLREAVRTRLFALSRDGILHVIGPSLHIQELENGSVAVSDDVRRLAAWCERHGIERHFTNIINIERLGV